MYASIQSNITYRSYPIIQIDSTERSDIIDSEIGKIIINLPIESIPKTESKNYNDLFEIDLSSIKCQKPDFETMSLTPAMIQYIREKDNIIFKISNIIDELIKENAFFREINKDRMITFLSNLIYKISSDDLNIISHDELKQRIEKIMFVEISCGILSDLSPSKIVEFNEIIKRRKFF